MLVVLIAHPMRRPPALMDLDVVGVFVVVGRVEDDLGVWLGLDVAGRDGLGHDGRTSFGDAEKTRVA